MSESEMKAGFTNAFFKPSQKQEFAWVGEMQEAKQKWLREQEKFYRLTDYRG